MELSYILRSSLSIPVAMLIAEAVTAMATPRKSEDNVRRGAALQAVGCRPYLVTGSPSWTTAPNAPNRGSYDGAGAFHGAILIT